MALLKVSRSKGSEEMDLGTFYAAVEEGDEQTVRRGLQAGVNVNVRRGRVQCTPLHRAAEEGHTGTCELLIRHRADVMARDKRQSTPLHEAAAGGHTGTCELLIRIGADVMARDGNQWTPLHRAAFGGHAGTCELLIRHGADVTAWDEEVRMVRQEMAVIREVSQDNFRLRSEYAKTMADNARSFVHDNEMELVDCEKLETRFNSYASFKLVIGKADSDKILLPEFWPSGILEHWLLPHDLHLLSELDADFSAYGTSPVNTEEGFLQGRPYGGVAVLWRQNIGLEVSIESCDEDRDADVPVEILLRGPEMARLYSEACSQGSLPMHSTRVPVVGQYRSGKTCLIKRLMGETVRKEEEEPITDGIDIISDVQTKTWKKSPETKHETSLSQQEATKTPIQASEGPEKDHEEQTEPDRPSNEYNKQSGTEFPSEEHQDKTQPELPNNEQPNIADTRSNVTSEKHHTVVIPDNVRESAERMRNAGITEEELGTATHPRLSFWDFGGQATYYGTHQCFITHLGVYILVMSLLQKLSDNVPDLDYKASVDNLRTGGDYLDHWLNSIYSQTQQHKVQPPAIIVLTHKDMVSEEYIEKYKEEIRSHIEGKAAGRLVMPDIFAVDNTTEDAAVDEIREYIRQVARSLPHMGEKIPISWLHLKSRLTKRREQGKKFLKFHEIVQLAQDLDINIKDKRTLATVLTFFHDRGDIIFFDEPGLRDDVTLQPQVMIDTFKTIITVPEYQQDRQDPKVKKMWERLEREGVLSDELLTRIWKERDRQLEEKGKKPFLIQHKSFLTVLMEKFYLICNATPISDTSEEAQEEEIRYFVPALLSCKRGDAELYPGNMHKCPQALYFVFSEKFLPSGMFCRLQALCVRRFGLKESRVFTGCARFPTDKEEETFVITKVNHYLKVELLSSSEIFTEGLRVRKFLSSALFEIKEKWIPCIQYELKFCSTQTEEGSEPAFQGLPTGDGPVEQDSRVPSAFRDVWMTGISQTHRTENSGGDGPVILQPTDDPSNMRTIGPVLDTMELGRGLSLDQCDNTRSRLTPKERVKNLVSLVENRYQLGAAVEMCYPEFADCFLREERGKELVILHTKDYTEEFASPLRTAVSEAGVSCHTENVLPTVSITEKVIEILLNTNNRMVLLVISPQALHHNHWSNLAYEFPVRNEKLLLPILLYPPGSRDWMVRVLQQRAPVLCKLTSMEMEMEGMTVSEDRLQEIVQKVMTDEERGFHQMLESIFSRLDDGDVRLLLRLWSARTGKQERTKIETPGDLMKAMLRTGYITTGTRNFLFYT
ncbi:uncharacterized protein LOC118417380 [Branchiostoma floridae]|uniref:Uncharacterized protein LOC118417380 n=1 Tax=Branchiostoma floridae TaxID=7739 RepID=A0A9J7LB14_BRAFL|nr:uncharacterized protein LOC118417380 [Branchiostoma floridae]